MIWILIQPIYCGEVKISWTQIETWIVKYVNAITTIKGHQLCIPVSIWSSISPASPSLHSLSSLSLLQTSLKCSFLLWTKAICPKPPTVSEKSFAKERIVLPWSSDEWQSVSIIELGLMQTDLWVIMEVIYEWSSIVTNTFNDDFKTSIKTHKE